MRKILFVLAIASFVVVGCKKETKEPKKEIKSEVLAENMKEISFKVSGMTCEIGCARTIQSKLAKKEGVIDAKVVFADSIATVKYDASKTNKKELMAFVEGVADGKTYKTSGCTCKGNCSKSKECKEQCDKKGEEGKKACKENCKKEGCANKKV